MELGSISAIIKQLCEAISELTGLGVIVADSTLKKIGNTYKASSAEIVGDINHTSIIKQIIDTGRPAVVDEHNMHFGCTVCKQKDSCKVEEFVGVPIFYNGQVIGAIALAASLGQSFRYFSSLQKVEHFLEKMADAIHDIMRCTDGTSTEACILTPGSLVEDNNSDVGYVITDADENIISSNRTFAQLFSEYRKEDIRNLTELFGDTITNAPEKFKFFLYSTQERDGFFGSVSVVPYSGESRTDASKIYLFRSMRMPSLSFERSCYNRQIPPFSSQGSAYALVFEQARSLASNRMPVVICGQDGNGKNIVANYIHTVSERKDDYFVTIDCSGISLYDQMEAVLGVPGDVSFNGLLWKAVKGTVYFKNIEYMSLELQKTLCRLFNGQLSASTYGVYGRMDIRFLFSCSCELDSLREKGSLRNELYRILADNIITIPELRTDEPYFSAMLDSFVSKFARMHGQSSIALSPELKESLRRSSHLTVMDLQRAADIIVTMAPPRTVGLSDIPALRGIASASVGPVNIDPQKDDLQSLLDRRIKKTVIAKALGISRSTLYRRIRELENS